jgi:hypothetical protein
MRILFCLPVLLCPAALLATPITWRLENVAYFGTEGPVTGWFTYDADTNTVLDWHIDSTGTLMSGATYNFTWPIYAPIESPAYVFPGGCTGDTNCDSIGNSQATTSNGLPAYTFSDFTEMTLSYDSLVLDALSDQLTLVTAEPLTDAGGTVPLVVVPTIPFDLIPGVSSNHSFDDLEGDQFTSAEDYLMSGELVAESPAAAPEPAMLLPLLTCSVVALAWRRKASRESDGSPGR